MTAGLGLAAALAYGISDLAGAVAVRRSSALAASLGTQLAGLPVLLVGLLLLPGRWSLEALLLGAVAGTVGTLGLVLYLRSMAVGPIGVISPLSALVGASVPVLWGLGLGGDRLRPAQLAGVALGLAAVVLVSWSPRAAERAYGRRGPAYALLAGVAFGLFFVVLDATPADSGLVPLVGSRVAGIVVMIVLIAVVRRPVSGRGAAGMIAIAGVGDMAANLLFLLATRSGQLSLASLTTSLYPVVALILARMLLSERLTGTQAGGVAIALVATGLLVS